MDGLLHKRAVILSSASSSFPSSHYYGGTIALGESSGKVSLIDPIEKSVMITFEGHKDGVTHIEFLDKDMHLLATSARKDNNILLWVSLIPDKRTLESRKLQ